MKTPTYSMLSFAFVLLLSTFSWAASVDNHGNFLHCLTRFSRNSTSISKVIYTPQNSSYTSVLKFNLQNLRFDTPSTPKPLVIVKPKEDSQIQTVIHCAKKHDIEMRIRNGGHDFEGLSYVAHVPFVILDMSNYHNIKVDPVAATAWVQSGATLGELYYKIAQKSNTLGFPAGVWSNVGVSGLIGGGGYGTLRRKYGLAADNVIDAHLIDANGKILNRKTMGEDLFWAIRGGGVSSFGVILDWKINLVKVPDNVTAFRVVKTLEQNATELVHRWQSVAPKLPKDLEIQVVANCIRKGAPSQPRKTVLGVANFIRKGAPSQPCKTVLSDSTTDSSDKTVEIQFISLFLGRVDELLPLMQKRFPELGLKREDCVEVSYIQSVLLFSLFPAEAPVEVLLNRTSCKIPFKSKSGFVDKPISKKGLNGIWEFLLKLEPEDTNMIFTSYGGRMAEIPESSIPFPHRAGTLYKMYMRVLMDGDTTKALHWIRSLYKYLGPYSTKSPRTAYVNYNDLDLGVNNRQDPTSYAKASKWGKRYFKNNFERLVEVKTRVDPNNFFRHEQSIPSLH